MIQVSRFDGPAAAAALVKYFNVDTGNKVVFWNIGNEPHCGQNTVAAAEDVARFVKSIAPAMKAVDPTIEIFAPDECDYLDLYYTALFSGTNNATDISGMVPNQSYYYVDGVSWHRYIGYPPGNVQISGLTTAGAADFLERVQETHTLIDRANRAQGRTGDDALQWGIGEFNSSEGGRVCSFENGQMFAQVYGYVMKYGGTYAATWSMFENSGSCSGTDYSFINSDGTPRATFYHMQMVSKNFSGHYLDGSSNRDKIRVYASIDIGEGRIAVMVLNIDTSVDQSCTVSLSAAPESPDGCHVVVPAELEASYELDIKSQTSVVLVFDSGGKVTKTVTYSSAHHRVGQAPTVTTQ
jgi:hypothetical protein